MIKKAVRILGFVAATLFVLQASGYAENPLDSFPSVLESKAYHQFNGRPVTEFSKLLYLIDRFEHSPIEVVYDGHYYQAVFAAKIARWFMARNYRKETVQEWIMRWCNTSIGGKLIYVKFPDGKFRLSREVLMDELKSLDAAMKEAELAAEQEKKQPAAADMLVPVASMIIKTDTPPAPSPKIETPQR